VTTKLNENAASGWGSRCNQRRKGDGAKERRGGRGGEGGKDNTHGPFFTQKEENGEKWMLHKFKEQGKEQWKKEGKETYSDDNEMQ